MDSSCKNKEYEVIVIGAGIMGSTTAYYLTKHYNPGEVLLLEQFDLLHRKGSSHGESRIIRRTYAKDHYTYLMKDAYKFWAEAEQEAGTKVFTQTGGLDFGLKDDVVMKQIIAAAQNHQVPHTIMKSDSAQLKQQFPMVKCPPNQIVLYCPDSGILNATKSVAMFQTLIKLNGGHIMDNAMVGKIEILNLAESKFQYKITLKNGNILYCKKCIITAGAWTQKLVKSNFNIELPLKVIQTTVAYYQVSNPESYSSSKFPVFIDYERNPIVYGTPAHEYPNLIKCCAHNGPDCDPDARSHEPMADTSDKRVGSFIANHFIGVCSEPTFTETCMYTISPDDDFIIDFLGVDNYPNLFIGCGFSGHGFKLGPVVGKILSQLAINGQHPYPTVQSHLSLSRFVSK